MTESQYIHRYLNTTADPDTRWTPWTYLKYTVHGSAWNYGHGYHRALMRAISRRVTAGTVVAIRSKGGSVAYVRAGVAEAEAST